MELRKCEGCVKFWLEFESNYFSLTTEKQCSNGISNIACRKKRRKYDNLENALENEQLANVVLAWPSLPPNVKETILFLAQRWFCGLDYL